MIELSLRRIIFKIKIKIKNNIHPAVLGVEITTSDDACNVGG